MGDRTYVRFTIPLAYIVSVQHRRKLAPVLARIPISVVVNEDAPMLGAAYQALSSQLQA